MDYKSKKEVVIITNYVISRLYKEMLKENSEI